MSVFQIARSIWIFCYDTFIGKDVSLKEAIRNHKRVLILLILFIVSMTLNLTIAKRTIEYRASAVHNRTRYKELESKVHDLDMKILKQEADYNKLLLQYQSFYRMHYDEKGDLIIHDARTGFPVGVLPKEEMDHNRHSSLSGPTDPTMLVEGITGGPEPPSRDPGMSVNVTVIKDTEASGPKADESTEKPKETKTPGASNDKRSRSK